MKSVGFPKEKPIERALAKTRGKKFLILGILAGLFLILFFASFFIGPSNLTFSESFLALFGNGTKSAVRIMQKLRLPHALAAVCVGGALGVSGLMMQTSLRNEMASPATLGASNAAALGASIAIITITNGSTTSSSYAVASNPYVVSLVALAFALGSIALVLFIGAFARFRPSEIILAGIALGALFQGVSVLIQYFADDVQLGAVLHWTFGDLERVTMGENAILGVVVGVCFLVLMLFANRFNALSGGDSFAKSVGVHVGWLRILALFLASLLAAVAISFAGIIGFLGIIAPHIMKRFLGYDHRYLLPGTLLCGAALLLAFDILTRLIGQSTLLPVGAVTALFGAPLFLFILFSRRGKQA